MPHVTIAPLNEVLGAEVYDLSLHNELAPPTIARIGDAFLTYSVLLFRQQKLSKPDLVRFSQAFGMPVPHPTNARDRDPEVPEVTIISNIVEDGRAVGALGNDEVHFHADLVFLHTPGSVSILYCVEAPDAGGDTLWTNGYAAYDALDDEMKQRISRLKVIYVHHNSAYNPATPATHPLVCTHPVSGRKTLFFSPSSAYAVVGISQEEGRALLDELYVHATQPRFVWRHQWQPGDLVMWDNRCTMHRREAFDNSQRRLMWRTQILGAPSS